MRRRPRAFWGITAVYDTVRKKGVDATDALLDERVYLRQTLHRCRLSRSCPDCDQRHRQRGMLLLDALPPKERIPLVLDS